MHRTDAVATLPRPILLSRPTRERSVADRPVDRVSEAAALIETGATRQARILLDGILRASPATGTAGQRLARHFAEGLLARLRGDAAETGNLYRDAPDPDAMLAAFQALVRHTPVVRFGYVAATRALIAALGDAPRLHLVDVGIGSGAQWTYALGALARRPVPIERLRLTGVDLPAPGPDPAHRLRAVGDALARRAAELRVPFAFEPVPAQAEDLVAGGIERRPDEALAVNAAFALHHVLPTEAGAAPGRDRDALLGYLRSLAPCLLTLVEPDLEHNALPLLPRVRESMRLYRAVFELLEALLPPGLPERRIIEEEFFGREIRNVTVGEGARRVERHERRAAWRRRMWRQGFAPIDLSGFAGGVARELQAPRPCTVRAAGGMLVLGWKDRPLIAASAWTPAAGDRPR